MTIRTRPTPRYDREQPSAASIVFLFLVLGSILSFTIWLGFNYGTENEAAIRSEEKLIKRDSLAPTYTYDGEIIRWYVFSDPESGIQYLVNDRGGCTPRLDKYGNIIGTESYE